MNPSEKPTPHRHPLHLEVSQAEVTKTLDANPDLADEAVTPAEEKALVEKIHELLEKLSALKNQPEGIPLSPHTIEEIAALEKRLHDCFGMEMKIAAIADQVHNSIPPNKLN